MVAGITALEPAQGAARGYFVFLHGILGSGINWRSFARAYMKASSKGDLGVLLVDLALHGDLRDQGPLVPNTVQATAQDLLARLTQGGWPILGICGHSFGGKVATLAARDLQAPAGVDPTQLWVLDSPPGARPEGQGSASTLQILEILSKAPQRFEARSDFLTWAKGQGIQPPVAAWLATNLRELPSGGYRFALDIVSIRALLDDFFELDSWPALLEVAGRRNWRANVVVAGRSDVFVPDERAKLAQACAQGPTTAFELPNAGHWLHVDAPQQLLSIMLSVGA